MKRNEGGFGVVEAALIIVIIGVIGFVLWYFVSAKDRNQLPDKIPAKQSTSQPLNLDMDYQKPPGWTESTSQEDNQRTVRTFSSADGVLIFITQPYDGRSLSALPAPTGYKEVTNKKEVKLQSALFANQYNTTKDTKSFTVTTFVMTTRYDVLMSLEDFNKPANAHVYQDFLDSFVPNGYKPAN